MHIFHHPRTSFFILFLPCKKRAAAVAVNITLGIQRFDYLPASVHTLVNAFITLLSCSTLEYIYLYMAPLTGRSLWGMWVLTLLYNKVRHFKRLKSSAAHTDRFQTMLLSRSLMGFMKRTTLEQKEQIHFPSLLPSHYKNKTFLNKIKAVGNETSRIYFTGE